MEPALNPPTFTSMPVVGRTSPRRRVTSSVVASSCALVVGNTVHSTISSFSRWATGGSATPGSACTAAVIASTAASSAAGSPVTSTSGALKPGPKPSDTRS